MLQQKGTITFNEISQQPEVWQDIIRIMNEKRQELSAWFRQEAFAQVLYTGAGSSYCAAQSCARSFISLTGATSYAFPSVDVFATKKLPYDDRRKSLLIVFSRSGQTTETIWAIDKIKEQSKNTKILVICPNKDSEMIAKADFPIVIEKAKEEAMMSTKAFTSFLFASKLFIGILMQNMNFLNELTKVPTMLDVKKYQIEMQKLSSGKYQQVIFGGEGSYYGLALASSLLMKGMSATASEAYHTLSLRHGNAAHASQQTLIVIFATDAMKKGEGVVVGEMAALKAPRMVICEEADSRLGLSDYVFQLKSGLSEYSRDMLMIPIVQLLAFYLCIAKGYNPDKPKHIVDVVKWKEPFYQ
ncbi:MAG: SIS domain-containing protein [Candidatus Xenobiia bacterium LiM19]